MKVGTIFTATDKLIDDTIITTDYDTEHQRFRTTHTTRGVSKEIHHWTNSIEARSGHSRTLRELTATISGTSDDSVQRSQRH